MVQFENCKMRAVKLPKKLAFEIHGLNNRIYCEKSNPAGIYFAADCTQRYKWLLRTTV